MPPGAASKGASVDGDNRPSGKPPVIVWSGPGVGGSGGGGPGTGHPTAGTGQFPGLAMGAKGRSKHGRNPSTAESTLSGISAPDSATVDDDNHSTSTTGRHSARETSSSTLADAESQAQAQAAAAAAAAAQEAKDRRRGPAIKVYRRGKDGYMSGTSTPPAAAGAAQRNDEQGVPLKTQMRMSPISASPILLSMPGIGASIAGRRRPDNPVLGLIYDSSRAAERFLLSLGTFDFLFLHLFLSFLPVRLDHLVFCFLSFATLLDRAAMLHEGGQYALLFATLCLIGSLDFLTYSWMRASSMLTTLADIVVYSQFTLHLTSAIPFRRETLPAPVDPSQPTAEEAAAALKSHPNPNFTVFGMTIPHLSISLLWSTVLLTSLSSTLPKSFWARLMQAHIVAASIHGGLRDTVLRYAEMKTELSARVDRVRGERWRDYVGKIGDDNKGDAKSKGLLKSSSANTRTAPGNDTSTTPAASSSASGSRAELLEPPPRPSHGRHGSTSSTLSLPDGTVAAPRTTGNSRVANPSALQRRKGAKGTSRESSKKDLDLSAGARGDGAMVPVKTGGAAVHARRYAAMEDQSSTDPSALYANFYEADDRFELVFRSFVNDPIWRNDSERCDVGWIVPASLKASLYIALKIDGELRKLKQERERESSMAGSSSGPKSKSLKGKKEQALQPTNKVMEELLRAIETEPDSRDPDQGEIRIASGLFVPISRIAVKIDDQSWPRKKWTISADMSHWKSTPPASSDTKYAWWDVDGDEDDMWTPAPVRMSIDVSGLEPAKEHEIKVAVLGFWSVGAKIFLRAGELDVVVGQNNQVALTSLLSAHRSSPGTSRAQACNDLRGTSQPTHLRGLWPQQTFGSTTGRKRLARVIKPFRSHDDQCPARSHGKRPGSHQAGRTGHETFASGPPANRQYPQGGSLFSEKDDWQRGSF